jgi:NDP-sugar pyrophosphorylase family protein
LPYNIHYIDETKPLGTAGALRQVKDKIKTDFFVSNCDIIVQSDYYEALQLHKKNSYCLTIFASMRNYVVPYGVCNLNDIGELSSIQEKPENNFLVNTGLYILNPNVLDFVKPDTFLDMTDLISMLLANNHSIGVFPISEKSWTDVGQWIEYKEALQKII